MATKRKAAPSEKGLVCPACGGRKWRAPHGPKEAVGGLRRKRVCRNVECGYELLTYERPVFGPRREG